MKTTTIAAIIAHTIKNLAGTNNRYTEVTIEALDAVHLNIAIMERGKWQRTRSIH
jgi:hypothetical protein